MKIVFKWGLFFVICFALYGATGFVEIPYNISSKGIIIPLREWKLERLSGSTLLSTEKDNITGRISSFSVLEFQRGDYAEFLSEGKVFSQGRINKGDTVGYIVSYEEERRLLVLNSQLEEYKRSLQVALTGEKQEQIDAARERFTLAGKEYETQRKLKERMESLHDSLLIGDEAWEIALNDYDIRKHNMQIARSFLEEVSAGAKPEEIELIRTNIESHRKQVEQTKKRLDAFNITTPFSGNIIFQHGSELSSELIVQVADMNEIIIKIPVQLYQLEYIRMEDTVRFSIQPGGQKYFAKVVSINNVVQYLDQKQHVFVTAILNNKSDIFLPNMRVQTEIICEPIVLRKSLMRMFNQVSEN